MCVRLCMHSSFFMIRLIILFSVYDLDDVIPIVSEGIHNAYIS